MTESTSVLRAESLVRKWAPKMGLAEFRLQVRCIAHDTPDAWALSFYDIEEMWGLLELPGDDWLPPDLLELLVLHELAHGLLQLAKSSKVMTEQACNRIARLARGDFTTQLANEHQAALVGDDWFDGKSKHATLDRREWLNVVADALPEKQREAINLLYFEGLSLREAAAVLGINHKAVEDRRDTAVKNLRKYFDALESKDWNAARKVISLREPEGGAEHGVVYELHHRCPTSNALIRASEATEDVDLLVFPVGNYGYGMPKGIPFQVTALDPCQACGKLIGCWFVWQAGDSGFNPGSIWVPPRG